jgi:GTP-binding protein
VWEEDTGECLGELLVAGDELKVAAGGIRGIGNTRFKSSTNRAPRQTTKGKPGEVRQLRLELKLLAEVGLLGLPNAGKSSLLRALSAAQPKVADYPFTTLYPTLGVVQPDPLRTFVMADIPGIIEGAAQGAGLGHRFLRHLSRTRMLLHLVDVATPRDDSELLNDVRSVVAELDTYDAVLTQRPRWLVLTKVDLLTDLEVTVMIALVRAEFPQLEQIFAISATASVGILELSRAVMTWLEEAREDAPGLDDE